MFIIYSCVYFVTRVSSRDLFVMKRMHFVFVSLLEVSRWSAPVVPAGTVQRMGRGGGYIEPIC